MNKKQQFWFGYTALSCVLFSINVGWLEEPYGSFGSLMAITLGVIMYHSNED